LARLGRLWKRTNMLALSPKRLAPDVAGQNGPVIPLD